MIIRIHPKQTKPDIDKHSEDREDANIHYKEDGPDMRVQGKVGDQLPTYKMNNPLAGEPGKMSHDQTAHRVQSYELEEELELDEDLLFEELLYEKKDRCYYQAKRKFRVFPSAYASGYIVRCRRGQIGRKKKANEEVEVEEGKGWTKKREDSVDCNNPRGFSERAHCQGKEKNNESIVLDDLELILEGTFDKEKSQGLHGWFSRAGGKGSSGWVDCNTCRTNPKTGRKTCKSCGRQSGEERSKYPACRPTPSACNRRGTSKKRGPMRVSWKKKKKANEGEE